jgi:hypothetical protein
MTKTYQITVTEAQAAAIAKACEAFSRLGLGQLDAAVLDNTQHLPDYWEHRAEAQEVLDQMVNKMGGGVYFANGGPSITNGAVPNHHRAAWDVSQVIRKKLNQDRNSQFQGHVNSNRPIQCGDEAIPTITDSDGGNWGY